MRLNGRVQTGVRRLHQLVHSGLWRATLIQRDHPSTLPTSSTTIINVWRTFHAWMDCCCIMSGHVLVTWHFTSPMVYLCIVLQYNKWSSMHWEFDEAWGYIHDSGHLRQGLFCLLSCQSSVTIYCTYVACYTCCTQGALHALVKIVRYSCSLCNHMPYDRRQATWWEVVFVHMIQDSVALALLSCLFFNFFFWLLAKATFLSFILLCLSSPFPPPPHVNSILILRSAILAWLSFKAFYS